MTSLRHLPMINVPAPELSIVEELSVRDEIRLPEITIVQEITIVPSIPAQQTAASRHVMALLADGVPLSLLCDLADPSGPPSPDIASSELADESTPGAPGRSVLGDLLTFRAAAAEGSGRGASARRALRRLRLG